MLIWGICIIITLSAFLIYASASIKAGIYIKSICKIKTSQKEVAITFDDGPDSIQTPKVLDVLKKYNLEAAFFLIGENIDLNIDIVKRIAKEGHLIGNHSYSHTGNFPILSKSKMAENIKMGITAIENIIGKGECKYFRPPFGVTNPTIGGCIKRANLISIGWSIRSFDTTKNLYREEDRKKINKKIAERLEPGAIILLHDRLKNSNVLLEEVINTIQQKGYTIKRFDKI